MKDIDIRNTIKTSMLKKYFEDVNSIVVDEMNISHGKARIDIAVINGALHGYEIKSEYDNLNRLSNQLSEYSKTFNYVTVISTSKHIKNLEKCLPNWCGIVMAYSTEAKIELIRHRPARKNKFTDKYSIAQLLWRSEVLDILNNIGVNKGVSAKNKFYLWKLLAETLNEKDLSQIVREKLKIRPNWKSE